MFELIDSMNLATIKIIGMVLSTIAGFIMSWISKRSVNYRKIDKSILGSFFLFFIYINMLPSVVIFLGVIFMVLFQIDEIYILMLLSAGMAIITIIILWAVMLKTERMKIMMDKARNTSKPLFLMLNWLSVASVVLAFVYLPFIILETQNIFMSAMFYVSWVLTIWWFSIIIIFIWRTAKYVYSDIRITLLDGEVISYSCSPQVCRVHKHYLRLLKRDDRGVIVYERHISEANIKQIEYF
ncbi:MAG: hypothetical protein FWD82_05195 [Defluviitaleaceae bacterium]|nr:hypothetical protein [Defluviitaleaceae bacterium]